MNQRKTILVLASTYPRWKEDHEPRFIHELCKRLTTEFHVIALVPDADKADPNGLFEGVEVIRYRYALKPLQTLVNNGGIVNNLKAHWWKWLLVPNFLLSQYLAVRHILKNRKIDLIHAHWLIPQGWIAKKLTQKSKIPYIVTSHGGDLYGLQGTYLTKIKRQVAESAQGMTVVSSAMEKHLKKININPKKLEVIPMGIDLETRFINDTLIQRNQNELLFVGRLVPKKGVNFLIDAFALLIIKYPTLKLKIVGFGPEESKLKAQAEKLNLQNSIEFLGALPQEKLPVLYQTASIFVAPFVRAENGDQEGLPVALMEAIGCGCPIVVGQVEGIEDLLGSDINDIAVNPKITDELNQAIINILDNPKEAYERSHRIRNNTISFIDWENVAKNYKKFIQSVLQTKF
jgi:glycosyltransferase involved in cell wall biosynthesis